MDASSAIVPDTHSQRSFSCSCPDIRPSSSHSCKRRHTKSTKGTAVQLHDMSASDPAAQDPSNSMEFQAQARNMQEHFDLLHQAIVSVRTSMSAGRSHVNSSNSMDMHSRYIPVKNPNSIPAIFVTGRQVFVNRRVRSHARQFYMVRIL